MKKSKKFILAVIVILVVAIGILLAFPDLVDNTEENANTINETENVDKIENPFD